MSAQSTELYDLVPYVLPLVTIRILPQCSSVSFSYPLSSAAMFRNRTARLILLLQCTLDLCSDFTPEPHMLKIGKHQSIPLCSKTFHIAYDHPMRYIYLNEELIDLV